MTKEEILNKAMFVVFPMDTHENNHETKIDVELLNETKIRFPNNNVYVLPVAKNDTYRGYGLNEHHFTTNYHLSYVFPLLVKTLGLNFEPTNYVVKEQYVEYKENTYNLTTISWNKECKYKITCPTLNVVAEANDLVYHKEYPCDNYAKTKYHHLYAFTHCVSKVEHVGMPPNNKKLLLVCDSQMVPTIPLLCNYYSEVFVLDNRYEWDKVNEFLKDVYFDDVVVELWRDAKYMSAQRRLDEMEKSLINYILV